MKVILQVYFTKTFHKLKSSSLPVKLVRDECHRTPMMISQHWFRWWLGAVRQQTIIWANLTQIYVTIWWPRPQWVKWFVFFLQDDWAEDCEKFLPFFKKKKDIFRCLLGGNSFVICIFIYRSNISAFHSKIVCEHCIPNRCIWISTVKHFIRNMFYCQS